MCARSTASWALLRAVRLPAGPLSINWCETCSLPRLDDLGIHPRKTTLLLKAPLLQASVHRRSNTCDARVLLADTWFISPLETNYLELGSHAQKMVLPRSCENYPVLGTYFLLL